ncbi:Tat pathway signal protein [Nocardioides aromaticivorans]|uniref:Tat pathway signal protein n=1 Tax=Nocardioides aromaticivorans TaxID=200618 RepID=A0ABX7PLV5_9ACTN|nr:esterase-like activity of phytase family protein [Nocardioides aromaticivorans]QSR26961.1 Tat pathway signal protein [Nocardioides aromaticivorans]
MRLLPAVSLLAVTVLATPAVAADTSYVDKRVTLPAIALEDVQSTVLDDHGVELGGIGSGLFALGRNEYWTVTDRGPNGEVGDARTFVVPEFTPTLVKVRARGNTLQVLETIPLTTPAGEPVTGLPNFAVAGDPAPVLADGTTPVAYNGNGLDTEGVVRTADGHFWLVDEYGPSIVEVDAAGHVVARHVPAGLEDDYVAAGADHPISGSLPAGLSARRGNRGFEDIALLPDGHTVVAALQSSVVVPGDRDRIITELVAFDTTTGTTVHEYGYRFDAPSTFAAGTRGRDLKISALVPVDQTHVIVEERTDTEARFHTIELDPADPLVTEADKTLLVNLAGVAGVPGKVEGAALKNASTLVVISDNDFGFVPRAYGLDEDVDPSGVRTVLAEVKLP